MGKGAKSPKDKKKKDVVSARRLDRAAKVFELRKGGGSFRAIAETLKKQAEAKGESTRGFSHTQVKADFELACRVANENLGDDVEQTRTLTAARLDDIFLRISPLMHPDYKPSTRMKAANVLIRANKEYAELFGAKKPKAVEVSGKNGGPITTVAMSLEEWNKQAEERLKDAAASVTDFDDDTADENSQD